MERFIADLAETSRGPDQPPQFCEAVTLAATVYAAGDAAKRSRTSPQMLGINHASTAARTHEDA